jgi:hypothetical protein
MENDIRKTIKKEVKILLESAHKQNDIYKISNTITKEIVDDPKNN